MSNPVSYQNMMAFMAKAKNISKGRPTGQRGTRIHLKSRYGESVPTIVQLYYHNTSLITWHPDGQVIFINQGWNTRTTINRMNEYLYHYGYRIVTRKGTKYLRAIIDAELSWAERELTDIFRIVFENGDLCNIMSY